MTSVVQSPPHSPSSRATLAGVSAIALWSLSGVCYAVGARALGTMPFLSISCGVAVVSIVLLRLLGHQPVLDLFRLPPRAAMLGFFGIAVYSLLLVSAMSLSPEENLAQVMLMNYLWPIWIVLLSLGLLPYPKRTSLVLAGAALAFTGVFIARGTSALHHPLAALIPQAMALLAGLLWAAYSVLLRRWNIPTRQSGTTFQFLLLALITGAIATRQGAWHAVATVHGHVLLITILSGIGPLGLAYYAWEIGMKRGALYSLALLSNFIPVASTALIALFFRKAMGPLLIPGAILIAAGAWIGQNAGNGPRKARVNAQAN